MSKIRSIPNLMDVRHSVRQSLYDTSIMDLDDTNFGTYIVGISNPKNPLMVHEVKHAFATQSIHNIHSILNSHSFKTLNWFVNNRAALYLKIFYPAPTPDVLPTFPAATYMYYDNWNYILIPANQKAHRLLNKRRHALFTEVQYVQWLLDVTGSGKNVRDNNNYKSFSSSLNKEAKLLDKALTKHLN